MQDYRTILLVEDSPEDLQATLRAFRNARVANPVVHCADGVTALDFLHHRGRFAPPNAQPLPGLILLDLNMPNLDGTEVLAQLKADPRLRSIPVIVLTTSKDDRDVQACYRMGANSFIQKPVNFDGLINAVKRLTDYWLELSVLPRTVAASDTIAGDGADEGTA